MTPFKRAGRVVPGLVLASFLLASAGPIAVAQDKAPPADGAGGSQEKEASEHFRRGVEFSKNNEFEAAFAEFTQAYELAPNYRVLYNLGQTSRELKDYASALRSLTRYLEEGGGEIEAKRRASVEGTIEELRAKTSTLTIEVNQPGAEIVVDDVAVGKSPLAEPVIVNAGKRRLGASKEGFAPVNRTIDLAGSVARTIKLELTSLETKVITVPGNAEVDTGPSPAAYVALGLTGAVAVAAGVTGGLSLAASSDYDSELNRFPGDRAKIDAARDRTQTFALATDVLMPIAGAGAIATIVLFVVTSGGDAPDAPEEPTKPTTSFDVGPTGFVVRGTF